MENHILSTFFRPFLWLAVVIASQSCSGYLDVRPSTNVAIPSTLQDVRLLLQATLTLNFRQPSSGVGMVDDFYVAASVIPGTTPVSQSAYLWDWQEYNWPNQWSRIYEAVNSANVALETMERIPVTAANREEWERLKGSALVFRSNAFLGALWAYARAYDEGRSANDPGIVLRHSTDINVPSFRSSVSECYQAVITGLTAAVPLLPRHAETPTYPTRAAAYGLLARTYLSMRMYDEALDYSDRCLQEHDDLLDFNGLTIPTTVATPFEPFNKEVVFSAIIRGFNAYAAEAPATASVDTALFDSYADADLRKRAFFVRRANGEIQFRGSYSFSSSHYFSGVSTAEMYLTRAECLARMDRVPEAMADLATVMKNRWDREVDFPETGVPNRSDALALVLQERRKELIGRNLRHMDIKRLNMEGHGIVVRRVVDGKVYELLPDDPRWAFPLPTDVIAQTGMPQNAY